MAEDLVKDFLEKSNDQFIQQLFDAPNDNEQDKLEFLIESFLQLFEMFHESYHISFDLVSSLITWINSHRDHVISPMQRGLTRLVHQTSLQPIKFKKSGKIDWLHVIRQAEKLPEIQVNLVPEFHGKSSFAHLLLSILEEEVDYFLKQPNAINSLLILLTSCLNYEQQNLNDLIDLFYEKGFRTPFLEFISGRSSEYSATRDVDQSEDDASLGEKVILYLCGALELDLEDMKLTPSQVKYLAELCGSFSSLCNLEAYNLNQFLSLLDTQQNSTQNNRTWEMFVSKVDVKCLSLAALQVLVEHYERVPPHKMAAILATSAECNRGKKFLKCLAEHFYLFSNRFVSLRSQALVRRWAESLSPKLKKVLWKDFLGGFLYSPFLVLKSLEEDIFIKFSSLFHQNFNDEHSGNLAASSFDLENTDDADAFQEIIIWISCALRGNTNNEMINFLLQKFLNSSDVLTPEASHVLPLVVDSPNFSQSDLLSKFIRSFSDEMYVSQECFWFLMKYLNSLENASVVVPSEVLKLLSASFFPELLAAGRTKTGKETVMKRNTAVGDESQIQSELIVLFNVVLLKMRFPENLSEFFPSEIADSKNIASISETEMIFRCHLATHYPSIFQGSSFISKIQEDYSGSLSISDQLIKRLLRELDLTGVATALDPELLMLSVPRMLETINQWAQICYFMQDPARCDKFVEFNVAFGRKWDRKGTTLNRQEQHVKVYDPEFVLGILQKELTEGTDHEQNGGRCTKVVHLLKFINSGRLSFLIMALSDVTPAPLVRIAKCLLMKVVLLLKQWPNEYARFFVDSLDLLRNSLKSEDDTLSYMQAHFYARVLLEVIHERLNDTAYKKEEEPLPQWWDKKPKFQRMMKQKEEMSKRKERLASLVKEILNTSENSANFPSKELVKLLTSSRKQSTFNSPEVLFATVCQGSVGPKSFKQMANSHLLSQLELALTSDLAPTIQKWLLVKSVFGNIAKCRKVFAKAVSEKQLDLLLLHLVDTRTPENEEIKQITRSTQMTFIEASIFDETGRFEPLDKLLKPSKCTLYLERYVSVFSQTPDFDASLISERQFAVIITLMLGADCSLQPANISCYNLAKFLELVESFGLYSGSSNEIKRPSIWNFSTYLRWTVSCCIEASSGGIDENQKFKFASKMKHLFKKVYFS